MTAEPDDGGVLGEIGRNAEMFRVLGHEIRLRLLILLAAGEHAVSEIDAVSGIGQPGLSQQLAILRKARLVTTRRVAKQVYYRVDPSVLEHAATLLERLAGASVSANAKQAPLRTGSGLKLGFKSAGSAASFARLL